MSELCFEGACSGPLLRADARFGPGLWVAAAQSWQALAVLVALAAGSEPPVRGRVLVDGAALAENPESRARVAGLLAVETLPEGRDLIASVARVLSARGEKKSAASVLATLGVAAWARRKPQELDATERRALALGLALEHERAGLYVLFEPLAANHALEPAAIRARVEEKANSGATVLVATTSAAEATAFGGARFEIEQGVLAPAGSALDAPGTPCALYALTQEPQRLVAAIADDPVLSGVSWDARTAPFLVTLHGSDLEALGAALTSAAVRAAVRIDSITHASGALPGAASAGVLAQSTGSPALEPRPYTSTTALPGGTGERPPDQSVSMPTAFADPLRKNPAPEET